MGIFKEKIIVTRGMKCMLPKHLESYGKLSNFLKNHCYSQREIKYLIQLEVDTKNRKQIVDRLVGCLMNLKKKELKKGIKSYAANRK